MSRTRKLRDYVWVLSSIYLLLGLVNILFAWLGLICFFTPLLISIFRGSKGYCNNYCGRGQLLNLLGSRLGLSRGRSLPRWVVSRKFRYGFLIFFMSMFANMLYATWRVFAGAGSLKEAVRLFWSFDLYWGWAYGGGAEPWAAQFAFGFYGIMLTSTLLGVLTMLFYRPRSWCVYCPMGTMTQMICRVKN